MTRATNNRMVKLLVGLVVVTVLGGVPALLVAGVVAVPFAEKV